MAAISPARKAAFRILLTVEQRQSHADDLLRGKAVNALSPADRNLTTALVLGVLRWQILLDHQLQSLLSVPTRTRCGRSHRFAPWGISDSAHDRIPARAAIDESVELVKQSGHRFASGMVNAVLRKLAGAATRIQFSEETATDLALACAHPLWMVERWWTAYGMEGARAICHHGQRQPAQTIRLADTAVEGELSDAGIALEPSQLLTAARRVVSGDVTSTAAFQEGRVRPQDEGSQLVGEIASVLGRGAATILDACAAPGGKTLILAERNPKAHILACETSPHRLGELRERVSRLARASSVALPTPQV